MRSNWWGDVSRAATRSRITPVLFWTCRWGRGGFRVAREAAMRRYYV